MPLEHVLRAIVALDDLPQLVATLGHEPKWEEIAPDSQLGDSRWARSVARLARVGAAHGFHWLAAETTEPGYQAGA